MCLEGVREERVLLCRRGEQPLECQFLHATGTTRHIDIPLRVGGNLVAATNHSLESNAGEDLQCLPIYDDNIVAAADIEKLLLRVR